MKKRWIAITLLLGGCAVGPNYKAPINDVPDTWEGPSDTGEVSISREAPETKWWQVFNDALLNNYIEKAVQHNNTILAAEANVLQARALRQVAASSLFPQLAANLNGTKTYFSKNGPIFAGPSLTQGPSSTTGLPFSIQTPQIQPLYNALLDATWEIDLFGRTRRSVEAAEANIGSAIEQKNDILISVLAEVARNYIDIRSSQQLAVLVEQDIALLEKKLAIVREQYMAGLANKLDLERLEAQLASAQADLPNLIAQVYQGIYTISILTGNLPEALAEELLPLQSMPEIPTKIAVGLRSDLLRRRPDVRRTERQLASATANIGVAVASFFPSIVLSADGGFQSLKFSNLFNWASRTWDYGGNINIPIFEGGQLVGNLHASRAVASYAAYTYQQTVLNALEEAESALITYTKAVEIVHDISRSTEKTRDVAGLTQARFDKGLVAYTDVLDALRQLNASDQALLNTDTSALLNVIVLYKALGGGWEVDFSTPIPDQQYTSIENGGSNESP